MSRKFAGGDRVIISQTPVDSSDKKYSGRLATVEAYTHTNGDLEVYRVMLDGDDYSHSFFDADLLPYGELEALRVELTQAEAQVVQLKEAIRLKERNGTDLPLSTVITAKGLFGPSVITKQAEDVWLNIFSTDDGEPASTIMDDERVTKYLAHDLNAVVRRP